MGITLKTFNDLDFQPHPYYPDGNLASMSFDNGISVSVISCKSCYSNPDDVIATYELAMFKDGEYIPLSPWDDVLGWQTEVELNVLFEKAQKDGDGFIQECKDNKTGKDFDG